MKPEEPKRLFVRDTESAITEHRRLYNRQQRDAADTNATDRAGCNRLDIMTDRMSELEARICTGRWTVDSVVMALPVSHV